MTSSAWHLAGSTLATWLLTYLVHSTLVLLAAWWLTRRVESPAQRLAIWRLALLGGLLSATLALALPNVFGRAVWRVDWGTVGAVLLAAWLLLGGALFALRVSAWRRLVLRLRRESLPTDASFPAVVDRLARAGGLSRLVRLSLSERLVAPVVLGAREVCFPRRVVEQLDDAQLEAVVAHELAHVQRGDGLWLWATALVETLCFPQRLNHLAGRRVAHDAELVCDDWAAQRTGRRRALAEGLAIVASWMSASGHERGLRPALGEEPSPLMQRVERLLAPAAASVPAARRPGGSLAWLLVLLAALACSGPALRVLPEATQPDAMSTPALIADARAASAILGARLLALPDGYRERHAAFLARPDTGAAPLLERGLYEFHPKRGGGAYYSFVTRDHDYNREPDVELSHGRLSSGFYGRSIGFVLDLGDVPIETLDVAEFRETLAPDVRALVGTLSEDLPEDSDSRDAYRAKLMASGIACTPPRYGTPVAEPRHTYLLRAVLPGEHDVLVALRVTELRHDGLLMLWRRLTEWPEPRSRSTRPEAVLDVSPAPAWMHGATTDALLAWRGDVSDELTRRLLASSGPHRVRLLQRWDLPDLIAVRGGGAYYSFAERSHAFSGASDLRYEQSELSTAHSGGILDLGQRPLHALDPAHAPDDLGALDARTWEALVHAEHDQRTRPWQPESALHELWTARREARVPDLTSTPAIVGHSYLLRSVTDGHDLLMAFEVVDEDADGITLEWRELTRG